MPSVSLGGKRTCGGAALQLRQYAIAAIRVRRKVSVAGGPSWVASA